jgi:hypothetical protein
MYNFHLFEFASSRRLWRISRGESTGETLGLNFDWRLIVQFRGSILPVAVEVAAVNLSDQVANLAT